MSSSRDRQILQARELDRLSTVLIDAGVRFVKRNPIPVGIYAFGLLICLFFSGLRVAPQHQKAFEKVLDTIDYDKLNISADIYYSAKRKYDASRGWFFTCNADCKKYKKQSELAYNDYQNEIKKEQLATATAKSHLGLFSTYGVAETRDLFWNKFAQGRGFAQRQSKWDALFLGIRAMGRNESFVEYILNVVINLLLNFTFGVFMAVVGFIFSLYSVIVSYQAPILQALPFFLLASLSAVAFALTWIVGLYVAAAGTAFVVVKAAASTILLEEGQRGRRQYVRYERYE